MHRGVALAHNSSCCAVVVATTRVPLEQQVAPGGSWQDGEEMLGTGWEGVHGAAALRIWWVASCPGGGLVGVDGAD